MASKKKSESRFKPNRKPVRLTLELKPEVMDLLYSLSTEVAGVAEDESAYVATIEAALQALNREMDQECAESSSSAEDSGGSSKT